MVTMRQSFRFRERFDVIWSVPDQKIEGKGVIYDISRAGMLFVTDSLFKPEHKLSMCFKCAKVPSFPPKGELAWFIRTGKAKASINAGCVFQMMLPIASHGSIGWIIIF